MTAEATSGNSGNDGKGSDSLEETAYRSHTVSGSEGARHKLHHSRGARSSAESKSDEAETWIDQQRDDSNVATMPSRERLGVVAVPSPHERRGESTDGQFFIIHTIFLL